MRLLSALSVVLLGVGCVGPSDDPTNVHDLRVLAVQFEPPEIMAPRCTADATNLAVFAFPVKMTVLVADPAGANRRLDYAVRACARSGDRRCDDEGDFKELSRGTIPSGESQFILSPGGALLDEVDPSTKFNVPLLERVAEYDAYGGLGGLRMPVDFAVKAGDEAVDAQKLMVFSCPLLPAMRANKTPVLPGVTWNGTVWGETDVPEFKGEGPFDLAPLPFEERQETYVVPSFSLKPVTLVESWKIAWYADMGRLSPQETGGTDVDGTTGRHRAQWKPGSTAMAGTVHFWFVVRDGRGGISWLSRSATWAP